MDNIDHVYYINLDHRNDRNIQFLGEVENMFKGGILENRIERFPAIENSNGALGCSMSHLAIIKDAKTKGYRNIIVFEDDFMFLVSRNVFEKQLDELFKLKYTINSNFDFKAVMLGYNAINQLKFNSLLDKTTNVQTTSGYIFNSTYYDELIECWEKAIHDFKNGGPEFIHTCDQSWKKIQNDKWYLFRMRTGKQRPSFSDCSKTYCDYKC
jgi:glycosyl transferase family 25